jgi:aspartyl-tRNA(Asn)/glutamyl-tRNA(Gln) amidotransferase subunit A
VGLKPTYGLVSARGVIPDSWSFDHVGPLCRTVADTALVLSVMAGYDPEYFCSIDRAAVDYSAASRLKAGALRLGIPRKLFSGKLDQEVQAAFDEALRVMSDLTAGHQDVELPGTPDLFAIVADAEAYAFHSVHLGRSPELYDPETRKQLTVGAKVTIPEYIQGRIALDVARSQVGALFKSVDLLVLPTAPRPALRIVDCHDAFAMPAFTGEFNIFGLPAISIPCGMTKSGLPIGLQIVGRRLGESDVLALASHYERSTRWHALRAANAA